MTVDHMKTLLRQYWWRNTYTGGVKIDYTNYKGERGERVIIPDVFSLRQVEYIDQAAKWHGPEAWVFDAADLSKEGEVRTFDVAKVHSWEVLK